MKILDIIDDVFRISSAIKNAYISFDEMTCSAVAVVSLLGVGQKLSVDAAKR
jgi:hypothetical protein